LESRQLLTSAAATAAPAPSALFAAASLPARPKSLIQLR